MPRKKEKRPTLERCLKDGTVQLDNGGYWGRAADKVEVSFGSDPDQVERYLEAHPTPDTW